ncbi:alanine aminotransferase 2-like isoform X1 [Orbicella faveolata]|uniref:alanine aminotransferase 2-like isoform X1 n=1 Tax=Orbicella faveolata TaxID=48498 RepID=UPI0009E22E30|nr:alanine aminotransferase 2-like isoform X1 [Orbicella faveolata]
MEAEVITETTISPVFQRTVNARGWVDFRAYEIQQELARGERKPFEEVIRHYGDPHAFGQRPITSLRQFLTCLLCPDFLDDPSYPQDIKEKARRILKTTPGFAISSYTDTIGLRIIREHVAKYISRRDGYPADPDDVILLNGGARGIQVGLASLKTSSHDGKGRAGLMVPIPVFPQYTARIVEYNFHQINYYLDEENNWSLNINELKRALEEAKPLCKPRGLVLINPGNPTGQILTYDNIRDLIKFCASEKLVLFADEVYQETVFTNEAKFHSCKKVLRDLGPDYNNFQLMSINSASKGFYGECGLRGAYMELVGFSKEVKHQFRNFMSPSVSPTTIGQAAVSAICTPPQPGDESYETFIKEKMAILDSYQRKAKITTSMLNSLEGITCSEVTGALYAFPRVHLPRKAIEEAKLNNCKPDEFYCWQMLEATGITPVPGTNFGQKPGTHHFRLTILPSEDKVVPMFETISKFHKEFMDKYKDDDDDKQ